MRQDLLDQDVKRPERLLQPLAISSGIEKAVDVVDPQTLHVAALDQFADQPVGPLEHLRQLHPQGRKLVDVEETAVVDLLGGDAPIGNAVYLSLEQAMQTPEARRPALLPVKARERRCNSAGYHRLIGALGQSYLQLRCELTRRRG